MINRIVCAGLATTAIAFIPHACTTESLGLATQLHTTVNVGGSPRAGYRVYAMFDDPDDYLTSISGSNANGPLVLQSLNANGSGPGSNFFDSTSGTPGDMATNASAAAIGTFMASDPLFISGNGYSNDNVVWFTPGPQEQGRAGGPNGVPIVFEGTPGLGVLIMQLAAPAGDNVAGTVNVGVSLEGFGGATIPGETFTSVIPAPAAALTIGALALARPARRRRERH